MIGAAFPMRVSDELLAATRDDEPLAQDMVNIWSHSAYAHYPSNPGPGFWVLGENLRLMQRIAEVNGPQLLPIDFAACNAYDDALGAAGALQCPALFILGERDQMTPPRAAKSLINACNDRTVVTLATGHAMMAEDPDGVRRALADFARRVFASETA